jgi:hypothetical protein
MSNIKDIIKARQDLETAKENAKMAEEAATREAEETAMKPFIEAYDELKDLPIKSSRGYRLSREKLSDICSGSSLSHGISFYTGYGDKFEVVPSYNQGKVRFSVQSKHHSNWMDFDGAFSAFLDTLARLVKID